MESPSFAGVSDAKEFSHALDYNRFAGPNLKQSRSDQKKTKIAYGTNATPCRTSMDRPPYGLGAAEQVVRTPECEAG
jgi:hypothetical protein